MEGFITSGRAIDLVLVLMLVEALWLWRRGRAQPPDLLLGLLPGALLLLAVRTALTEGSPLMVAALIALSLPAHLADLRRRGW